MSPLAVLALGANLGDREATLRRAARDLAAHPRITLTRASPIVRSRPVGGPAGQADYLNAVVEVEAEGTARHLLEICLAIEEEMGRLRGERWGPRTIDLDLLTFGHEEIDEPGLRVPHPRMHERAFVLAPLLELTADPKLPGGRRVADLRLGPELLLGARPFGPPLA